jgi:glycosyltransferase involved in cell wall biosynthesis
LLVRDRVTGLVFQPRDPVDLAAKIRVVIEHPGDAQRMGQAGRELALSHDLAITRSEFANLYSELVSMARHG